MYVQHSFSVSVAAVKSSADMIQHVPQRLKNDSAFGLAVAYHQVAALIHGPHIKQESRVCIVAYFSLQRKKNNLTEDERVYKREILGELRRLRKKTTPICVQCQ